MLYIYLVSSFEYSHKNLANIAKQQCVFTKNIPVIRRTAEHSAYGCKRRKEKYTFSKLTTILYTVIKFDLNYVHYKIQNYKLRQIVYFVKRNNLKGICLGDTILIAIKMLKYVIKM